MTTYLTQDPADYAAAQEERLLALGCSAEYAAAERARLVANAQQVASAFESNMREMQGARS